MKIRNKKQIFNQKVLYFAYGSNLSVERLVKRVGKVKHCGTFKISDHKLCFNTGTQFTSFANIMYSEGDVIEGVIYEMTYGQLRLLDKYEGLYERLFIELDEGRFKGRKLHIYKSYYERPEFIRPITKEYYDAIFKGAELNKLTTVIDFMENHAKAKIESEEHKYMNLYNNWY